MKYPDGPPPAMPERFRGMPALDGSKCAAGCQACAKVCPTGAIVARQTGSGALGLKAPDPLAPVAEGLRIDLGRCLFCGECAAACPEGAIRFTTDHRLAARKREDLWADGKAYALAEALGADLKRILGRALRLRQVSAGGCGACEADANVLTTVGWDIGRFGIQFVASPRHADGLLVTGPVSQNMRLALEKTWAAVPAPKIVIASGACAIAGGPYIDHPEVCNGAAAVVPVDLYVPGCPPHPLTLLDGLLRLLGRVC
jgi:Ni,Fe-hydrogenase III small subunit/NAD-dependent dihydropyrimidine dehydrogenase PreA subunit